MKMVNMAVRLNCMDVKFASRDLGANVLPILFSGGIDGHFNRNRSSLNLLAIDLFDSALLFSLVGKVNKCEAFAFALGGTILPV